MKKLKIALVLMFAACCSLFLFACKEEEDLTLGKELTLSGYKTDFTEADTEFTTGNIVVTASFKTDDPEKATRVLTADEYVVKADGIKAAIEAAQNGDYSSARGTYTVEVEYTYGERTAVGEYNVTLDHAWEKNGDVYKCDIDGAEKEVYAVNDQITVGAWGSTPEVSEGAKVAKATNGSNYLTYGSISLGQAITISGTGYTATGSQTWDTPVLGIQKDNNLFLAREDTWVIGTDGNWVDCAWQLHSGGSAAVAMPDGTIESWLESAVEWEVYYSGTAVAATDWGTEPVDFTITWDYNEAGYITISTVIKNSLTLNRYIKVPGPTYEIALYAEDFTMNITEVSIIRNLKLDNVTLDETPTTTVYAENTMLDIGSDKNLGGVVLMGHYNTESENPLDIAITSYDILATIVTGEGEDQESVDYDLREEPVQAGMTNFRIVYGAYNFPISIEVVASSIKGVTNSYDFTHGGVQFENSGAEYVYGVNGSKQIAVTGSGVVNRLTAEQQTALGTENEYYYVAFHLYGDDSEKIASATCTAEGAVCEVAGNGVNVIVPVGTSVPSSFMVTVVSDVTASTTVYVDLSAVKVPAVSAVIVSNNSTLDGGGDITVAYYGFTESSIKDEKFYVNSGNTTYEKVSQEGGYKLPSGIVLSGKWNGTVYEVTYSVPAIDVTTSEFNLSYEVRVGDASVQMPYALKVSENANENGWYKINDTTYLASQSALNTVLTVVVLEDSRNLQGKSGEIKLNVQNSIGTVYDLSFTATLSGTAAKNAVFTFNSANDLSNKAKGVLGISGTIGDNTDGDYGAVYLIEIDVTETLDLDLGNGFYVEIPGMEAEGVYSLLKYTKDNNDNVTVNIVEVKLTDTKKTDIKGTCIVNGLAYYTYDGFAFNQSIGLPADGEHEWTNGVCSKCGSVKYGDDTELGMNVAAIENATTNGFSVSFQLSENAADWGANIITPLDKDGKSTGAHIGIPNLDPYSSTIGPNSTNAYPGTGGGTLYNGAAYNVFQNTTSIVTITVSPSTGVTFYKDGVKVLNYAYTSLFSDGKSSIGLFVDAVLENVEKYGFEFGAGVHGTDDEGNTVNYVGKGASLVVYSAALDDGQVAAEYAIVYGGLNANGYTSISGSLGDEDTNATVFVDWVSVDAIAKGTAVTYYGTQKSEMADNWDAMLFEFSDNAHWSQRMDNYGWAFPNEEIMQNVSMTPSITDADGETIASDDDSFWKLYKEIAADCTWQLTVNFESNGTVTSTLVVNGANGGVYTDVCVWNFGDLEVPDSIGLHFTAEDSYVSILYSVTGEAVTTQAE